MDSSKSLLPEPLVISAAKSIDDLLSREWLLTNSLGSYASSSVLGANTRRYHGLLIAATRPPVRRIAAVNYLLDQYVISAVGGEQAFDLTSVEFEGAINPDAQPHLVEFRNDLAVAYLYRCGDAQLLKEIILGESVNAVAVRYRLLSGPAGRLRIRPFLAMRDYHSLRKADQPQQMTYSYNLGELRVEDRQLNSEAVHLWLAPAGDAGGPAGRQRASFAGAPQWWKRFLYRGDLSRGHEGLEDLYSPGSFEMALLPDQPVQLTASVGDPKEVNFEATLAQKRRRLERIVRHVGAGADTLTKRLAVASDAFLAERRRAGEQPRRTILAGYHWFVDWGRDAMVSLPGLLLETGRHEEALEVLNSFAAAMQNGLIPNRFDDYTQAAHYNTIDASLWFVLACDRYAALTGGGPGWPQNLAGPVERIIQVYHDGAMFDIRADSDGLLTGGSEQTQLTWMDVKLAGQPVTPRHGKCVEINALWHAALRAAARRAADPHQAQHFADLAQRVSSAFSPTFWNAHAGCLFDCVLGEYKDGSIRPNQILAVSLPGSPLPVQQQRSVLSVVQQELLTPYGLRTLSPRDSRYRGRFGISLESRDRAYHNGMVWPWLMGPFIEAHLRVHDFSPASRQQARKWLSAFNEHLCAAGIGSISEVFDGDPPHDPGGCIAQAWSVAEVLRALRLADAGDARPPALPSAAMATRA